MPEVKITISNKVQHFLDRYYPANKTLEERFYQALSEGNLVPKGKGFCLSFEMNIKFDDLVKEDECSRDMYNSSEYDSYL